MIKFSFALIRMRKGSAEWIARLNFKWFCASRFDQVGPSYLFDGVLHFAWAYSNACTLQSLTPSFCGVKLQHRK